MHLLLCRFIRFPQRVGPWCFQKPVSTFANHDLSPDGEWIATSDFGPRVTIHRFAEPNKIVTHLAGENRAYDTAVAFARGGRRLYTGNEDGRIRVWDTVTWQELPKLGWLAHRGAVTAIAVSHDRTLIATSGDSTLKLFPIDPEPGEPHRRERLSFLLDQPANWIQFAADENGRDRALLHSAPGRTLEIWETDRDGKQTEPLQEDSDSLPFPLSSHAAVLLSSGEVLVVGGESNISVTQHVALSDCHLYAPATGTSTGTSTGTWTTTSSLRSPRKGIQLTRLPGGEVLVAGGLGHGGAALASCELYDPESGTWQPAGPLSTPRAGGARILLQSGKVLAVGGIDANGKALATCELFDPDSATWSHTGALPAAPSPDVPAVRLENGMVLVVGLPSENGWQGCCLYDPATGTWTPTGSTAVVREEATATLLPGGNVLLAGGSDIHGSPVSDCELYDPTTGDWQTCRALPAPRTRHTATLLPNGKVLVAGGDIEKLRTPAARALLYDPETDAWSDAPNLLRPRSSHTATLLNNIGKVLLVGGSDLGGMTKSVEEYDADAGVAEHRTSNVEHPTSTSTSTSTSKES